MKRIGFIGLGIMGLPMASRLIDSGLELTIWNRTPDRAAPLVERGAKAVDSPADVIASCEVTFSMLADPTAVEAVCFRSDGVLAATGEGHDYVDCSTVGPETSRTIGAMIREAGGRFLEAPVAGSRKPAQEGELLFLCSGDESLYGDVLPLLQRMGRRCFFLGETGNGARMKLVNNLVMGIMMASLAEGLTLAGRVGLRPEDLLEVLDAGAMSNPMFRLKGPLMTTGRFDVAFPLRHMQKDLRLALAMADVVEQPLPTAAAANGLFLAARKGGLADKDFSAVLKAFV